MRAVIQQSENQAADKPRVAIIGLGFSGAAAASALLAEAKFPFSLLLIDGNGSLGEGLAYGKAYAGELLNVRARDLSLLATERGDFAAWLQQSVLGGGKGAPKIDLGQIFAPRALFGEYVRERLFQSFRSRPDVDVQLIAEEAVGVSLPDAGRMRIRFASGPALDCDAAVLATGYGTARTPRRFGADPYVKALPAAAAHAEHVILVGSSLTMIDTLLRLRRVNSKARISIISRNALLPFSQLRHSPEPVKFAPPDDPSARSLLAAVRRQCRDALERGESWQAVINGIRNAAQALWPQVPIAEQRRVLRRLKTYWDIHRHRIPGDIHAALELEFASQRTQKLAGEVTGISGEGPFEVHLRLRGQRVTTVMSADLVFDCSGWRPDIDAPIIRELIGQGLASPDPHGLGLSVGRDFRLKTTATEAPIFAIGPLCIGSLFEITAAPEIAAQAKSMASELCARLAAIPTLSNELARTLADEKALHAP